MSKDLTDALAALSRDPRRPPAEKPQPRGSARRVVSSGQPSAGAKSESSGIASPLTELNASTREYWSDAWHTTDGLFSFPAIKKIQMADANEDPVELHFANPAA